MLAWVRRLLWVEAVVLRELRTGRVARKQRPAQQQGGEAPHAGSTAVSAPMRLHLRSQLPQPVREARPFEQLPRAPSNDGARKFTSQATRYLSCMSTPPPVALTATPCCVEETRTSTPA